MSFLNKINSHLLHYTWDLAYGKFDESLLRRGITANDVSIINNPFKDKWFADPFIYDEDECSIQFFVEEFDCHVKRGRIARLLVDKRTNTINECHIILDLPTHLSFPAIYRSKDKTLVQPENSASGKSFFYEYDKSIDQLINPRLAIDEPLTDAIIRVIDNKFVMSATLLNNPNGNELSIYCSDTLLGPYASETKIMFPNSSARMAGHFINNIRPAQNSNGDYGKAVWFYDESNTVIGKINPWGRYSGIHTFNTLNNTFVIDLKKYDHQLLYKFREMLKNN